MAQYYGYDNNQGGMMGRLFGNIPEVTRNLFIVNALMFIATLINQNFMVGTFAVFYPKSPFFRWWQPVTYLHVHAREFLAHLREHVGTPDVRFRT